jgi:hypothetical protein
MKNFLDVNQHFWGRHVDDLYANWTTRSVAASTTDKATLVEYGIYSLQAMEDGYFLAGDSDVDLSDLTVVGRFVKAGQIIVVHLYAASKNYVAFLARDAIASKWQYIQLGRRE